jgi:hypothetical protein
MAVNQQSNSNGEQYGETTSEPTTENKVPKPVLEQDAKLEEQFANADQYDPGKSLNTEKQGEVKHYWYPQHEVGNKKQLDHTGNGFKELEKYGCVHFEIYYFPAPATGNQVSKDYENSKVAVDAAAKGVNDLLRNGNLDFATIRKGISVGTDIFTGIVKMSYAAVGAASNSISVDTTSQNVGGVNASSTGDQVVASSLAQYKDNEWFKINIYLPFNNSYQVTRAPGIKQEDNQMKDIGISLYKTSYGMFKDAAGAAGLASNVSASGLNIRNFVAPRLSAPDLESYSYSWELYPRSAIEMNHIKNIMRYFSYLSTPSFERKSVFYTIPPVMTMEIITTNFLVDEVSSKSSNRTRKLRPKRQYYLTNYTATFSTNTDGSMILTPDGYPMFITLKIDLIKTDISTNNELHAYPFM